MKLKRYKQAMKYKVMCKMSDYELLSQYNPHFISSKINLMDQQIEDMYHLNTSHSESTIFGFVAVSYPIEKLAIWIIEQKQALDNYRRRSEIKVRRLKAVMESYTPKERKAIMAYMRSNGRIRHQETIERLKEDLYRIDRNERLKRKNARRQQQEIEKEIKVEAIKLQAGIAV